MKKTALFLAIVLISLPAMSQGKKYKKSMLKTIEMMNEASDRESSLDVVAAFEEIAGQYPDQWIPFYDAAQILITTSFMESDMASSDELLERAIKNLDKAEELAPEESEIEALKVMYYMGMMSADPETRGPMYYQDAFISIEKSKELNPENPRAFYLDGIMALNMPDFMGGGPQAAKPIFLKAAEKFKSYENEDPLWPSWGEELVEEELEKMEDL